MATNYRQAISRAFDTTSDALKVLFSAGTAVIGKVIIRNSADTADIDPLAEDTFTGRVGEVQASPTSNTILARLKDLLTGIILAAGTALIGKVTIRNSADDADIDPLAEDTFTGRIGEVQASPTSNTLLDRLKTIATNVSNLATTIVLATGSNVIGKVRLVTATGDEVTDDTQDAIKTFRTAAGLSNSGVLSGDTSIKASAGKVYWLTVSDTAALAIELNDSVDNGGSDKWAVDLPADGYGHFIFDPPIEFSNGIYLDVSTATCKVTVGYI